MSTLGTWIVCTLYCHPTEPSQPDRCAVNEAKNQRGASVRVKGRLRILMVATGAVVVREIHARTDSAALVYVCNRYMCYQVRCWSR